MRRHRNAKIVATLGPSSATPERIRHLFEAGADVFRLNFSFGTYAEHKESCATIRAIEREAGRPIGILVDLQGPKLRVGAFADGSVLLTPGSSFRFDLTGGPGNQERVGLPHPEVFRVLTPGTELLLDDGNIRLKVESCGENHAETRVIVGGTLSAHKGVSVVNTALPLSPLTAKDRADLAYGLELGADWIALSFVQRPEDIQELRDIVGGRAGIMPKLEKPAALAHLDAIVALSDAVMVARGDLGVELPPEQVPPIQQRIIRACRLAGKPSIVATQMLESMTRLPRPTRAEVSDVASAVYHGADAVMLSAESASGQFPVEAVAMMDRIIAAAEADKVYYRAVTDAARPQPAATIPDTICAALQRITSVLPVAATVTYTVSGTTSLLAARERLETSILSLATNEKVARRLALGWGLHSMQAPELATVDEMSSYACEAALREGFAAKGDTIAMASGTPIGVQGSTNMIKVLTV